MILNTFNKILETALNPATDDTTPSETSSQQISLNEAVQLVIQLHQTHRLDDAEALYLKLLEIDPQNPDLLHFYGLLKHQQGYSEQAAEWVQKALALAPDYIDAHNNLGNIYLQLGQPESAEPCFKRVIQIDANHADAYGNLGIVQRQLSQFEQAIESLQKAIALDPEVARHHQNLGNVYRNLGEFTKASDFYVTSLKLNPLDSEAYSKLCRTLYLMDDMERCEATLQAWLKHDPENPTALHLYAAYTHADIPSRASDAYVRQTFDHFAASFDGVLTRLEYQAPNLVNQTLLDLGQDMSNWHLLDAGCGTGLFGTLARPWVKRLDGVDLSPNMLERAKARKVYDALFEAELTDYLTQYPTHYHCISCVDTLCYFGDLTDVLRSSLTALKPAGWFIFTVEKQDEHKATPDFCLNSHGRYSHTESYLRNLLSRAGFVIRHFDTEVLRMESGNPVMGFVISAQAAVTNQGGTDKNVDDTEYYFNV